MDITKVSAPFILISLIGIFWPYTLYPLILFVKSFRKKTRWYDEAFLPSVSMIITAHNEEQTIREKIENSLHLDYPREKFQLIIASDASTDRTNSIVREFAAQGVILVELTARAGKTAAQNASLSYAQGEIVVFSDATTLYQSQSVRKLVRNFAEPCVGCVGGNLIYTLDKKNFNVGSQKYWNLEKTIKLLEAKNGILFGLSGCMYAARKQLCTPLDIRVMEDLGRPLLSCAQGFLNILEPEAICFEKVNPTIQSEIIMRQRVISRTVVTLTILSQKILFHKKPLLLFAIVSHKVIRYLLPFFTLMLATGCFLNQTPMLNQLILLVLGYSLFSFLIIRSASFRLPGIFFYAITIPGYFFLSNLAVLKAFLGITQRKNETFWESHRP